MVHDFHFNSYECVTLVYIIQLRIKKMLENFSETDLDKFENIQKEFLTTWKMYAQVNNSYFNSRHHVSVDLNHQEIRKLMEKGV